MRLPVVISLCALGVLSASGCREGALISSRGDLAVRESALSFGEVYVGAPQSRIVHVSNHGRALLSLSLQIDPPFVLGDGALTKLESGGQAAIEVRFEPASPGPAHGVLRIGTDSESAEVELSATALAPPACSSADPCTRMAFDPARRVCVSTSQPDGTSCHIGCIDEGTCDRGRCVGTERSCEDSDLCTVDACSSDGSCLHTPAECAPPSNPCLAAVCDPGSGCGEVIVPDGTPCGRRGCDVQDVCVAGACMERIPPEGAVCGDPSPCQELGTCAAHTCVRPPSTELSRLWSYTPQANGRYLGDLVADADGNLYLGEVRGPPSYETQVVSLQSDGTVRWRSTVANAGLLDLRVQSVLGDQVLAASRSEVFAIDRRSGAVLWSTSVEPILAPDLVQHPPVGEGPFDFVASNFFEGEDGTIGLLVNHRSLNQSPGGAWLVLLDAGTGAALQEQWIGDGAPNLIAVPGDSSIYVSVGRYQEGGLWTTLCAFDMDLHARGSCSPGRTLEWPVSAVPGHVFSNSVVLEAGAGTATFLYDSTLKMEAWTSSGPLSWTAPNVVSDGQTAWLVTSRWGSDYSAHYDLSAIDLAGGGELWHLPLIATPAEKVKREFVRPPKLTSAGTLLFARRFTGTKGSSDGYLLEEATTTGRITFECPFPQTIDAWAVLDWLLVRGQAITVEPPGRIVAYSVLDRAPAAHGWVSAQGNEGHSNAPLP